MDFLLELDAPPPPRKVEVAAGPATPNSLFELDAPVPSARTPAAAPTPNPAAEAAAAAAKKALFELDAPSPAAQAAPTAARGDTSATMEFMSELETSGADVERPANERSTMEFMFEVDAPSRSTSGEIDLDAEPEVAAALHAAAARQAAADAADAPAPVVAAVPAVAVAHVDLSAFAGAAPDKPKTTEAQHEQRVQRSAQRVLACRDTFRMLGFLNIPEEDRKNVARMLMEVDASLGRGEGAASVVKEPEAVLLSATREQLDVVERLLGPIEDKLLYLDEAVAHDAFRARVDSAKQPKKILARYARLLASRRFQAGARRDRFEWIVTHLLTTVSASGLRQVMAPQRARSVLQHVIGGLPRKSNEQETNEAISYLQDALVRVTTVATQEEFFDGGVYIDVHGYKVSMRDQLLVPEFVYLSVLINAAVHNRLEGWIADRERLHRGNQLTSEGSPRDQVMRRVREAEEAVDDLFSVRRRAPTQARVEPAKQPAPAKKKAKDKSRTRSLLPRLEIVVDRQLILLLGALLVIAGAGTTIAFQTGTIGAPQVRALEDGEIEQISPLLARAWIAGAGDDSRLDAVVYDDRWQLLDPRKRTSEAERISKSLAERQVPSALITDRHGGKLIEIDKGFVAFVQGGKI